MARYRRAYRRLQFCRPAFLLLRKAEVHSVHIWRARFAASRLTLHMLAAVAEDEARRITEQTKAALQAAKARGRKLGTSIAAKTVAKGMKTLAGRSQWQPVQVFRLLAHDV